MKNFEYYSPTRILFGKDTELEVVRLLKMNKANKVLIHYGRNSVVKSGLLKKVQDLLSSAKIDYVLLGNVMPNPRLSLVRKGVELAKSEQVDFILAIGGGSVIDSAKAIAYGACVDFDVWQFYTREKIPEKCLSVGVILTIAAAGSETSKSSVITNEESGLKRSCASDLSRPKFAIMDPILTYSVSKYQTANGVVDILMHTMERYFTTDDTLELTDKIAEGLMIDVLQYSKIAYNDPTNYEARANLMWAGSISHKDLTGLGHQSDFATHKLGHELSALYDTSHGASLSATWASWARYVYQTKTSRFVKFARNVLNIELSDEEATINAAIDFVENYFKELQMPISIKELAKSKKSDIEYLAKMATNDKKISIGNFKKLTYDDVKKIYEMAWK